jgi:hypothetical protein
MMEGDIDQAEQLCRAGLRIRRELSDKRGLVSCLEASGEVAQAQDRSERAMRLCAAAAAVRDALGVSLSPVERVQLDRTLTSARTQLGEAAFAAAWSSGAVMGLEQAVAYALDEVEPT